MITGALPLPNSREVLDHIIRKVMRELRILGSNSREGANNNVLGNMAMDFDFSFLMGEGYDYS